MAEKCSHSRPRDLQRAGRGVQNGLLQAVEGSGSHGLAEDTRDRREIRPGPVCQISPRYFHRKNTGEVAPRSRCPILEA